MSLLRPAFCDTSKKWFRTGSDLIVLYEFFRLVTFNEENHCWLMLIGWNGFWVPPKKLDPTTAELVKPRPTYDVTRCIGPTDPTASPVLKHCETGRLDCLTEVRWTAVWTASYISTISCSDRVQEKNLKHRNWYRPPSRLTFAVHITTAVFRGKKQKVGFQTWCIWIPTILWAQENRDTSCPTIASAS